VSFALLNSDSDCDSTLIVIVSALAASQQKVKRAGLGEREGRAEKGLEPTRGGDDREKEKNRNSKYDTRP
jgi:hypothetical protein